MMLMLYLGLIASASKTLIDYLHYNKNEKKTFNAPHFVAKYQQKDLSSRDGNRTQFHSRMLITGMLIQLKPHRDGYRCKNPPERAR